LNENKQNFILFYFILSWVMRSRRRPGIIIF
jgi:hypothetical protein